MAYTQTAWQDHVVDAQGNVIQQGTPVSATNLNHLEQGVHDAHQQFADQSKQQFQAKYGLNYLETDQASPLDYVIKGRTLVNLLGRDGNCDDPNQWSKSNSPTVTVDTVNFYTGAKSLKVTNGSGKTFGSIYQTVNVDNSKYYLVVAVIKNGNATKGYIKLQSSAAIVSENATSTSGFTNLAVKIDPTRIPGSILTVELVIEGAEGQYIYVDSMAVYEVSAADYAKIGTTITESTTPSIDDVWPYVDGVKHLNGAGIALAGKNLLPPFTEWTLHDNVIVNDTYDLTLNATANSQGALFEIPCIPNTKYTVSAEEIIGKLFIYSGDYLGQINSSQKTFTFTTVSYRIILSFTNDTSGAGVYVLKRPQLELGSDETAFKPRNDDFAYIDTKLASSIDSSVVDTFDSRLGTVTRQWKADVALDGSLTWSRSQHSPSVKYVVASIATTYPKSIGHSEFVTGHDGRLLQMQRGTFNLELADSTWFGGDNLGIVIANNDSGWGGDYITPSSAEIAAYFLGWRMNNGTFGTPYDGSGTKTWVPLNATDNTEAVTIVPTTPSAAITSGTYDYYRLSYQLATPVTEELVPEGTLSSHNGSNQYELLSGVIVREHVRPVLYSGHFRINYYYGGADSRLKNKPVQIFAVHKNGMVDTRWNIEKNDPGGAFGGIIYATKNAEFYDPTATYTVTYQALDRYSLTTNPVDLAFYYNTNLKTVVDNLVQDMADVETDSSIAIRAMADIYKRLKALGG